MDRRPEPPRTAKIVLAVIVENGGGGSSTAAPVARALFDAWLEEFPAADQSSVISQVDQEGGL